MMKSIEQILKKQAKHDALFNEVLERTPMITVPVAPVQHVQLDRDMTETRSRSSLPNDPINPIKPVESLEELIGLEEKLQDQNYMDELIGLLTFICGTRDVGNGANHCYKLVDFIFTRQFMTTCSWAGGSREQKEKVPFKMFKHVISMFFQLVHMADTTFTLEQCENFFKGVLKNSVRRNERGKTGVVRCSKTKNRPKKLVYRARELRDCEFIEQDVLEIDSKVFQDSLDICDQIL